jgi:hypothetical protein
VPADFTITFGAHIRPSEIADLCISIGHYSHVERLSDREYSATIIRPAKRKPLSEMLARWERLGKVRVSKNSN